MSTFTIDTEDSRDLRALVMMGTVAEWRPAGQRGGNQAFVVPSQSGRQPVTATVEGCSCEDSRRGFRCKHRRAVQLYLAMVQAQHVLDAHAHRRHLRAV